MTWFKQWFGADYYEIYKGRDEAQALSQVQSLLKKLPSTPHLALDMGCGAGRHLKAFKELGVSAVGLDLSFYLLSKATGVRVVCADKEGLPFKKSRFDLLTSFFTSFGYYDEVHDNWNLLKEWILLVKPGGYLFLDLMNDETVLERLPYHSHDEIEGKQVIQKRRYDAGRVIKEIIIQSEHKAPKHFIEKVWCFSLAEVRYYARQMGLIEVGLFGDECLNDYVRSQSSRMAFLWKVP